MKFSNSLIVSLLAVIYLLFAYVPANGEEVKDSTTNLQEVVVEGRTQRVVKFGVEYIPGKKMKKMAMDANHLLAQMMIPSLRTDLNTGQVVAVDGKSISYFIDYRPAEDADLAGMRTEDVLRVEVLDYPDDPRFNGAAKVINFIMQKYEWGGYTKINGIGTIISTRFWSGSVYSKFVKDKWTFSLSLMNRGLRNHNTTNSIETESYKDIDFQGKYYDMLERTLRCGDGYRENYTHTDGWFRFAYEGNKSYIQHTLFLSGFDKSKLDSSSITFTGNLVAPSISHTYDSNSSFSQGISGYYNFTTSSKSSVFVHWIFRHDRNKGNSSHIYNNENPIANENVENGYSPSVYAGYSQSLNNNNMLRFTVCTRNNIFKTHYMGSYMGTQKMLSSDNDFSVEYFHNWKFGLNLYAQAGVNYSINRIDGETTMDKLNPLAKLQLGYQFNDRNNLSFIAAWMSNTPEASSSSSVLIQSNELLWLQGNPDLNTSHIYGFSMNYSFVPTNWFNMYAYLNYDKETNRPTAYYYSLPGHDGIVRGTLNDSDKTSYEAVVSGSFSLLNNSLNFNLSGGAQRVEFSGINPQTWQWLWGRVSASYYLI